MADPSAFIAYPSAPSTIGDTIEKAVHDIDRLEGQGRFLTWRASDIAGKFIGEKILDDIQARAALVADITLFNFNVTYEIGYAIGQHKRLLLIRHAAIGVDPDAGELGIFDTIGYRDYQNALELCGILNSIKDVSPLSLQTGQIKTVQPVYLLEPRFKIDQMTRLVSRIKKAKLFYRSFDPNEELRLSPSDAIRNVAQSYGIIVPLLPSIFPEFRVHNLRAAFIAGLTARGVSGRR